jgi:hypothetical protein
MTYESVVNKGVEILLNRMDSHPEEFVRQPLLVRTGRGATGAMRWDWVIESLLRRVENNHTSTFDYRLDLPFLSNEEVNILYDKYLRIQGEAFTQRVMSELLKEDRARA